MTSNPFDAPEGTPESKDDSPAPEATAAPDAPETPAAPEEPGTWEPAFSTEPQEPTGPLADDPAAWEPPVFHAPEGSSGETAAAPATAEPTGPAAPSAPAWTAPPASEAPVAPEAPVYGQPAHGQPAYGQQPPAYGQQAPVYGQQPPAYGAPAYGPPVTPNLTLNLWLSVFFYWLPALIFFLVEKDKVAPSYAAANAGNLNFQIVRTIAVVVASILMPIPFLGGLLFAAVMIAGLVVSIIHALNVPARAAAGQAPGYIFAPDWVK